MRRLRRFLRLLYIAFSKPVIRAWRDSAERPVQVKPTLPPLPRFTPPSVRAAVMEITGEPEPPKGKKRHRTIGVFGDRV